MVAIRRRQRTHLARIVVAVSVLVSVATIFILGGDAVSYGPVALIGVTNENRNAGIASQEKASPLEIGLWRHQLRSSCQNLIGSIPKVNNNNINITEDHLQRKEQVEAIALKKLYIPNPDRVHMKKQQPYKFCNNVFIDLGTNRGDTIAAALDATMDVCSPIFLEVDPTLKKSYRMSRKFPHPHFDADEMRLHGKGFKGFGLATKLQKFFGKALDDLCVYGMEGNPHFTGQLQKLDAVVNAMNPRPLGHLHIHTETVVAPSDGPTTLYVDKVSAKDHFWGSSLIKSMPDVRKTANQNNGTMVDARVLGVTLSQLLRHTLAAFNPEAESASSTSRGGGSLLVKMDIEGAEYSIIKELAASGTLCQYVRMNNNATLIVEYHQRLFRDDSEKLKEMEGLKEAREKLKQCGVVFTQLPNFFTG